MKRISIDLEKLLFLFAFAAFLVAAGFYFSEHRHSNRLYDVIDGAQAIARECLGEGQAQVDTLASEINQALFLGRGSRTDRSVDH